VALRFFTLAKKGEQMKANRFVRALGIIAATALTTAGLAAVSIPADAAAKSTVTLLSPVEITSLNSSTSAGNTAYNSMVSYLTGAGFTYYDDNPTLIANKDFGTQKVTKNKAKDFEVTYTVKPGQTWSDGTPIDAVDLLLSHVVASEKYSIAAGLGDPAKDKPAFDSIGYGGAYGAHVVGNPALSADHMSIVVKFDQPMPDWELLAPGPSPVHALEQLIDGKKKLGTAAANVAAKAQFLKDYNSKNTSRLKKMGAKWSTAYNLNNINKNTNPLLLISNGGFIVSKATTGVSMTLVRNPKYNSGPKMATKNPIKTIVIKIIADNAASVQALANGDIDVYYNTLPTGADKSALSQIAGATVKTAVAGGYSHLDLRTGPMNGTTAPYTGPFAGNSEKAKDLRHAFLLATPRDQLVNTIVRPVMSSAKPMDTQFAFTGSPEYNTIVKSSGVAEYSAGTQADRTAKALALVKKWFPDASETNPGFTVKLAHADSATRRSLTALIAAEAKKAGIEVKEFNLPNFFDDGVYNGPDYDATMFGFGLNSISQSNGVESYKTDGGNNIWGWSDAGVDVLAKSLQGDYLTPKQITAKRLGIDKVVHDNYWGLALYQNPTITAYINKLHNIKPAPIGQNTVWNYWQWHY
jgi:peptide/nickel transport system substrate-binding protein